VIGPTGTAVRRVAYTALLGRYERLNDDQAQSTSVRFICFTDDPQLTSDRWEIELIVPEFPLDLVRSQRVIKLRGHESLDEFDETLYIDNSVSLRRDAADLLDEWLADADVAIPLHSFRDSLTDEFAEVVASGLDDHHVVYEQFDHYAATQPEVLRARPLWCGMIARRQAPRVRAAFVVWLDHVMRYSRRDQLSVRAALATSGVIMDELEIDNHVSPWHTWPANLERNVAARLAAGSMRVPDLLRVAQLQAELAETRRIGAAQIENLHIEMAAQFEESQRLGAAKAESVRREMAAHLEEAQRLGAAQVENVRREMAAHLEEARSEEASLLRSRSWRATAPLREIASRARRLRHP